MARVVWASGEQRVSRWSERASLRPCEGPGSTPVNEGGVKALSKGQDGNQR